MYTLAACQCQTLAQIPHSTCGSRAEHFSLVCFCSLTIIPPRSRKTAPPSTPKKGGGGKNKTQIDQSTEFQSQQELSSTDDSATLKDVRKTQGTLTTALAAITTEVNNLPNNRAPMAATPTEQPGTSAVENPTVTFSTIPDPSMDEQVRIQVA